MLRLEYLEYRLQQSTTGRAVLDLFARHSDEVRMLAQTQRAVRVAWNRNYGPRFISEGLRDAPDQDLWFIPQVEDIRLGTLIRKMAAVFLDHASPELSHAIGENLPRVLAWTTTHRGLDDLFAHFRNLDQNN